MSRGMIGAHHQGYKSYSDEWLTPRRILDPLGAFDLDPCAPEKRPWDTAVNHFSFKDNGLAQEWRGRVWMNPPYGASLPRWMKKLALHRNGIALVFARTETEWFRELVWPIASGLLFVYGRITFHNPDGSLSSHNAGAPSVLISYDNAWPPPNQQALRKAELAIYGKFVPLCHSIAEMNRALLNLEER